MSRDISFLRIFAFAAPPKNGEPEPTMKTVRIFESSIDEQALAESAEILRGGGAVIYPTDSFYAIGCSAVNQGAVERLCRLKGIDPRKETLSIICCGISQASEYARIDNRSFKIMKENTPGSFTFILPAATTLPKVFKGRKTVGVRIPADGIARVLAESLGNPILSTAVTDDEGNQVVSGPDVSAPRWLSEVEMAIDGGETPGEETTVVSLLDSSAPEILRAGAGELR